MLIPPELLTISRPKELAPAIAPASPIAASQSKKPRQIALAGLLVSLYLDSLERDQILSSRTFLSVDYIELHSRTLG